MIQQPGNTNLEQEPITGKYREAFSLIFGAIEEYHKELGYPPAHGDEIHLPTMSKIHRELCLALVMEVSELVDSIPWKPWRPYDYKSWDLTNSSEEINDCMFFLGSIRENLGRNPHELADIFERKLIENKRRILIGYNKASTDME